MIDCSANHSNMIPTSRLAHGGENRTTPQYIKLDDSGGIQDDPLYKRQEALSRCKVNGGPPSVMPARHSTNTGTLSRFA